MLSHVIMYLIVYIIIPLAFAPYIIMILYQENILFSQRDVFKQL